MRAHKARLVVVSGVLCSVAATGLATAATAGAKIGAPYIREGSSGTGVRCVQLAVNLDVPSQHLAVDGIDGPATTAGVKAYQRFWGLPVDGIVGPSTGTVVWDDDSYLHHPECFNYVPTHP